MEKRLVAFVVAFRTHRDATSFEQPKNGVVSYSIDEGGARPKSNYFKFDIDTNATIGQIWNDQLKKVKTEEGL